MTSIKSQLIELLPELRRYCYSVAGNRDDGNDLLQSSIIRALSKQALFDDSRELKRWMFTIIKNIWVDQKRKEQRAGSHVDIDEELISDDRHLADDSIKITMNKVLSTMAILPENQQMVAYLVLVEGLSYKETSRHLDMPIGSVMGNLSRARKRLAELLIKQGELV